MQIKVHFRYGYGIQVLGGHGPLQLANTDANEWQCGKFYLLYFFWLSFNSFAFIEIAK